MNYLAHVAVALACDLTTNEELLGAVLPDLSGMADVRFEKELLPLKVGLGVACHYATDTAFHSHPAFVAGSEGIRQRLAGSGLDSGPRRAVAHVGWELLLDGSIAVLPEVVESFAAAVSDADAASSALSIDARTRWATFANEMLSRKVWEQYGEPAFVAARIRMVLRTRPRLALREEDMHSVIEALEEVGQRVADLSAVVVSDVARAVAGATVETLGPTPGLIGH